MKRIKLSLWLLGVSSALLISCSKKYSSPTTGDATNHLQFTTVISADDEEETIFNNVFDDVMGTNNKVGLGTGIGIFQVVDSSLPCYTITIYPADSITYPKTVTIDFGVGCTTSDGHTRAGQIVTTYSGPITVKGSTATTTLTDYIVDTLEVTGTQTITNVSTNDTTLYTVAVQNGKISMTSGNYISWNKSQTWKQIAGQSTQSQTLLADVFSITGTSSGTVLTTVNDSTFNDSTLVWSPNYVQTQFQWTAQISTPCTRQFPCAWIEQGQNEFTWSGFEAVLDYGQGNCIDESTLLLNAYHYSIVQ